MAAKELVVAREDAKSRLDRYVAAQLPEFSRSRVQELIRGGFVRRNGNAARPRDAVATGDVVVVDEPAVEKLETKAEAIPLDVLFEDEDLVVINKPAGLVVHPGAGNREGTLVNALLSHCTNLSGIGGIERPGIVHRLDKETSGCIVVAKNDAAHHELTRQFAGRTVLKIYAALVFGRVAKGSGIIEAPIARHRVHRQRMAVTASGGRAAKTEYRVVRSGARGSLVECTLHTGRTHQIRVHMHHIGHPVLGDKVYGKRAAADLPRQMLHAWKLGFHHPRTGEWQQFEAPLPNDFAVALQQLAPEATESSPVPAVR